MYMSGLSSAEQKLYGGLLPPAPIKGKQGYYQVCNAAEWEALPLPYKVMEWEPVKDDRDNGRLKAVKAVIFDVTYMEPYKINAKVSVHPSDVQKILFCLYDKPECLLYSVCGVELEDGQQIAAKWLQDSVSGAFGIYAAGQYVGRQGGFRGFVPERVQQMEDGKFVYDFNKTVAHRTYYELSNPFGRTQQRQETKPALDMTIAEAEAAKTPEKETQVKQPQSINRL